MELEEDPAEKNQLFSNTLYIFSLTGGGSGVLKFKNIQDEIVKLLLLQQPSAPWFLWCASEWQIIYLKAITLRNISYHRLREPVKKNTRVWPPPPPPTDESVEKKFQKKTWSKMA